MHPDVVPEQAQSFKDSSQTTEEEESRCGHIANTSGGMSW